MNKYKCFFLASILMFCILTRLNAQLATQSTDNLIADQTQIEQINNNLRAIQKARNKIKKAISFGRFIQKLDSLEDRLKGQRRKLVLARVIIITIFLMVVGAFLYIHYGDEIVTLYYNHIVKQE